MICNAPTKFLFALDGLYFLHMWMVAKMILKLKSEQRKLYNFAKSKKRLPNPTPIPVIWNKISRDMGKKSEKVTYKMHFWSCIWPCRERPEASKLTIIVVNVHFSHNLHNILYDLFHTKKIQIFWVASYETDMLKSCGKKKFYCRYQYSFNYISLNTCVILWNS